VAFEFRVTVAEADGAVLSSGEARLLDLPMLLGRRPSPKVDEDFSLVCSVENPGASDLRWLRRLTIDSQKTGSVAAVTNRKDVITLDDDHYYQVSLTFLPTVTYQ